MPEEQVPAGINKAWQDMTEEELRAALGYWTLKAENAEGWGAAHGSAVKFQEGALREMKRRGIVK